MNNFRILFILLTTIFFTNQLVWANNPPSNLRSDYRVNPLGTDNKKPTFSWVITSAERGASQTAYEIWMSTDEKKLGSGKDLFWQTGKTAGNQTFGICFTGKDLKSFTRYYWKVRTWNEKGIPSIWSQTSWFETAMMRPLDWKAEWISNQRLLPEKEEDFYKETPNPLLRKDFDIKKELKSARLYIAGLGYSVAYINGQRVGDQVLDMPWTQYAKEIQYSTYDVTALINKGNNTIGVMLGNGWYNPMPIKLFQTWNLRNTLTVGKPCVKAQLRITYNDGSTATLVTDDGWKTGDGPVLKNSVYLGETYDARLEQTGWNKPGFKEVAWTSAKQISGPEGKLTAKSIPPIRITKILKPVKITEPKPGVYLFDFGQNFAGEPRLIAKGPIGTTIVLRTGEDIHPDGSLNYLTVIAGQLKGMWNLTGGPGCPKDPMNIITYTMKGEGEEVYSPQFTFSSFRYVEVTGYPGKPNLNSIEGLRMNADLQETGFFECSNPMFNQIQAAVKWTFLSNVFSVQSDCPAREKLGYGADIVTTAEAFSYNFDMSSFYRKIVQDFVNDARPHGGMTEIAPNIGINAESMGDNTGSPGWQLAFPFGMKVLYDYYGDQFTVEKNYEVLKKQVDYMHSVTPDHIIKKDIGDHASIDPKPIALSATAFYYHHVKILADFAGILQKNNDGISYQKLADDIKNAFVKNFLKPGTGVFDSGTQAAQLISLYYNLVPTAEKEAAVSHLLLEIYNKHKGHLSAGIYGTKFLFEVFRKENRNDVAYNVANQRTFPGWGNMLAHGATTLYESWKYPDTVDSQNHPMFGSISEWYYKSILGINATAPGFTKMEIKPQPAGDLTWAKGHYDAVVGRISTEWKIEGVRFSMKISIPGNTNVLVYVPSSPGKKVFEEKELASNSNGLKFLGYREGYAIFEAMSGDYSFTSMVDQY